MSAPKKPKAPRSKGQTVVITITENHREQTAHIECKFIPDVKADSPITPAMAIAFKMLESATRKEGEE